MSIAKRSAVGLSPAWIDAFGRHRRISASTRAAIQRAMRLDGAGRPGADEPVVVARRGAALMAPAELVTEDGTDLGWQRRVPRDLPFGYHHLRDGERDQLLIVAPGRCWLASGFREWGWAVQLYGVRSSASWGIGDLADLRRLAAWSRRRGAGALLVNPMGAPNPGPDPEPSPYFPSSRRFRDPMLIRVDEVPGAERAAAAVTELASQARALNTERIIRRSRVVELKRGALEAIWRSIGGASGWSRSVERYVSDQGQPLADWAIFSVLGEELGSSWRSWPEEFRDPRSAAVRRFALAREDRVAFHVWVQWLIDQQLERAAAAGPRIITDLPVGFDPDGFDAWSWQAVLTQDASIGAPPDLFNLVGQDWGLPPFVPHRLRQAGLRPFIDTVRAVLRHAGGMRIDHVLGLFRLWWVPAGSIPAEGAYVRYPVDELLAVLAVESVRAGALVIGEDLGTVEPGVRRQLAARGLLSTRLLYFEGRRPAAYPRRVFAAVTTHDLPTVRGVWEGDDIDDLRRAGAPADLDQYAALRRQLARAARVPLDASTDETILATHAALAASPACLVVATLEDAARVVERPNVPGTSSEQRPNWSLALPNSLDKLERDPFVRRLTGALARG